MFYKPNLRFFVIAVLIASVRYCLGAAPALPGQVVQGAASDLARVERISSQITELESEYDEALTANDIQRIDRILDVIFNEIDPQVAMLSESESQNFIVGFDKLSTLKALICSCFTNLGAMPVVDQAITGPVALHVSSPVSVPLVSPAPFHRAPQPEGSYRDNSSASTDTEDSSTDNSVSSEEPEVLRAHCSLQPAELEDPYKYASAPPLEQAEPYAYVAPQPAQLEDPYKYDFVPPLEQEEFYAHVAPQQAEPEDTYKYASAPPLEQEGLPAQANDSTLTKPNLPKAVVPQVVMPNNIWECPICLKGTTFFVPTVTLKCGHKFHRKCVQKWVKEHRECPYCRGPVETKDVKGPSYGFF